MSRAAIEWCVPGVVIRLGIAWLGLFAAIFPVAAMGPQNPAFHPLYPPRPLTRSVVVPPTKPASLPAKRKGKLTKEERKRIAAAMKSRMPGRKEPPAQKGVR